jgi:hypothetical protein
MWRSSLAYGRRPGDEHAVSFDARAPTSYGNTCTTDGDARSANRDADAHAAHSDCYTGAADSDAAASHKYPGTDARSKRR